MALNCIFCADVPLKNYSLTHRLTSGHTARGVSESIYVSNAGYQWLEVLRCCLVWSWGVFSLRWSHFILSNFAYCLVNLRCSRWITVYGLVVNVLVSVAVSVQGSLGLISEVFLVLHIKLRWKTFPGFIKVTDVHFLPFDLPLSNSSSVVAEESHNIQYDIIR